MSKEQLTWQGMSPQEVVDAWEPLGWRDITGRALREIAECQHAHIDVRITALQLLNAAVHDKLIPAGPELVTYVASLLIQIIKGDAPRKIKEKIRTEMHERLAATQVLLRTIENYTSVADTSAEQLANAN